MTTEQLGELRDLRRENRRLRMERDFLKKSCGLLRQGELVDHELIASEKANYPVSLMCNVLEVSRSGCYASIDREPSKRERDNAKIVAEIREVHQASLSEYQGFIDEVIGRQLNRHCEAKLATEKARLQPLPSSRLPAYTSYRAPRSADPASCALAAGPTRYHRG